MLSRKKSLFVLFFLVVLILGIYFRFHYIDLTRFEHEMVRDVELGGRVLEGEYPLHGVLPSVESTAQNTFGPLSYYLMAIGLFFAPDNYSYPISAIFVIALLDILGAFIAYQIGKEFFGPTVGLLTFSFYLLSPWQIIHVATVLSPTSFLPIFVLLFFYSVFKLVLHNEDVYVIPAIVFLALQMHLHLTSFLLAFAFLIILVLFKRNFNKTYFALGILLALLTFTPYLVENLPDKVIASQYTLATQRAESTLLQTTLESFGVPVLFMTPHLGAFTLGKTVSLFQQTSSEYLFFMITGIFILLFIGSVVYFLRKLSKELPRSFISLKQTLSVLNNSLQNNKTFRKYSLLFILLVLPLLVYSIKGSNVTPHYFIIVFPLQIVLLSIFLVHLLKKKYITTLLVILLLLLSNAIYLHSYYSFVESNGGTKGITGIPYANKMEVVEYILQDGEEELPIVYYVGQKPLTQSMNYLLELNGRERNYKVITSLEEFDKGYLILDRYSFYSTFTNAKLPIEDYPAIDALEPNSFKHLEVIKKA
tara:strand:+ start:728 stop:2329 length:1602 start_codon:yes stop_codon:yes gene_type:complete